MRVERADYNAAAYVALRMREMDAVELSATCWCEGRAELASYCARVFSDSPGGLAFFDGAEPIAIGALMEHRPNVLTLGMYATDEFPRIARAFTRYVKRDLLVPAIERGVHRIEAVSLDSHTDAHKWLRFLGLHTESLMRGYGKGGETFVQLSWVSPCMSGR